MCFENQKVLQKCRYYDFNQLKVRPSGLLGFDSKSQSLWQHKQTEGVSLRIHSFIHFFYYYYSYLMLDLFKSCQLIITLHLYLHTTFGHIDIKIKLRVCFLERSTEIKLFNI